MSKTVKTPTYWQKDRYQPLVEMKTVYGNSVQVPKRFTDAWWSINITREAIVADGLEPLDFLHEDEFPYYDIERVYYEIYEEND